MGYLISWHFITSENKKRGYIFSHYGSLPPCFLCILKGESELDVKSQLGSGWLQTQVPTDKLASLVLWQEGVSLVV